MMNRYYVGNFIDNTDEFDKMMRKMMEEDARRAAEFDRLFNPFRLIAAQKQQPQNLMNGLEIKQVIFNEPATIVMWSDGTKTVVKCGEHDTFNKEAGLALCISKKMMGNKEFRSTFEKYCNAPAKEENK